MDTGAFESKTSEFSIWLQTETMTTEPRRIVRTDEKEILISKVEPGFAQQLHQTLDLLGLDSQRGILAGLPERMWSNFDGVTPRVDAWRLGIIQSLIDNQGKLSLNDERVKEIQIGVESVAALLEATLWSAPILADEEYTPKKGEIQAFHDNLRTLADGSDIFTRFYGQYENKTVVNHCPGALIARQLLISGWECCTKTPAPTVG